MRILLLNYEFPPVGGGAATASSEIARHLAASGVEVAVLTSHVKGLVPREMRDGFEIHRVPVMRHRLDYCSFPEMGAFVVGAALPALQLASKFRPDVMHVFFGLPTGPVGLLVNRLKGVPYLLSLRGDDVPGRQEGALALGHRLVRPLIRRVWSRAGMLVVNGEALRLRAQRVLPGRNVEVVPNGIDLEMFSPAGRAPDRRKVRVLYVGRLHKQKGLQYLLQGISMLDPEVRE